MKTIKTEEGYEVRVSADGRGMYVLTCVTSAGTVAHKLPVWVVRALMGKSACIDPRPLCVTCSKSWTPPEGVDASFLPCSTCAPEDHQPKEASAAEVREYRSKLTEDFCTYGVEDFSHGCRRRGGHSGPHTYSLNEARRLDAVVTHEDLRKLKDELIEALDTVVKARPQVLNEWSAGFRELAQILRARKS